MENFKMKTLKKKISKKQLEIIEMTENQKEL